MKPKFASDEEMLETLQRGCAAQGGEVLEFSAYRLNADGTKTETFRWSK